MDISELIKSYNAEQKNVFTGFCIQLPLCFSILYLYIPEFKSLDVYLQIIFTATSSILSIYFSFIWLCLCSSISKRRYKLEAFILILPILVTSSKLLISPSDYILGYEHALTTFLQASAILYTPFAIFGLILRKCIECINSYLLLLFYNLLHIFFINLEHLLSKDSQSSNYIYIDPLWFQYIADNRTSFDEAYQ